MDERWRILTRIRAVRARLALNEVTRERRVRARAQANLEQARDVKARYEEQAAQGVQLLASQSQQAQAGQGTFDAAQAQDILNFVTASRLRAQQAAVPVRRAQIQCDRAQTAVDAASSKYRQEAARKEAVDSRWQTLVRTARRQRLEREDASCAEDLSGASVARGLCEDAQWREDHRGSLEDGDDE